MAGSDEGKTQRNMEDSKLLAKRCSKSPRAN